MSLCEGTITYFRALNLKFFLFFYIFRAKVLRTFDASDDSTEMHVMVPKELEKWHEKLGYWLKSNMSEVFQYIWPLLVMFLKEKVQEWIGGAMGHFQRPNPNIELQRRGMLGN